MERSVSPIQLGELILEGAVITLSVELIFRNIYSFRKYKNWKVQSLKVALGIGMAVKSAIFSSFNSDTLGNNCRLAGRVGNSFFHVGCIAGLCILLLRVMVLVPSQYRVVAIAFHIAVVVTRFVLAVLDTVWAHVWIAPVTGICVFKDKHEIAAAYTLFDFTMDMYVTATVSIILTSHIRRSNLMGVEGNMSLYVSVVLTNAFRTFILSIINLICTVYLFVDNSDPANVLVIWPISSIFLILMIGYDTDITKTIRQLKTRILRPQQNNNLSSDCHGSLTSAIEEDPDPAHNHVLLEQHPSADSSLILGDTTDPEINVSKSSVVVTQQDISYPSTILDMTANDITDFSLTNNSPYR
ncbi:hypothetical protein INT47_009430, partial [Mucor saturninus]